MIQILLVDDHAIVRKGYRALLEKQQDLEIIAEALTGEEAYILYKKLTPDLIIIDLSLPGQSGLASIVKIKKFHPKAKILVFSMHQNPAIVLKAMESGARGYVSKSSEPDVLIRAIYDVFNDKLALSGDIAQALAIEKVDNEHSALSDLTVREFEILRMLVETKSTDEIAEHLNISPKTVSNTHYIIKRKLCVSSDIELTHKAIKMKVINPLEFYE